MKRLLLALILVALLALGLADLEITSSDPWLELGRMAQGALTPQIAPLWEVRQALLNTLIFALFGTFLGVVGGSLLSFFFAWAPVRWLCASLRAVHEIFWAFLLLPLVGLNALCGILAIAIPYLGIFAKVYAEIRQEAKDLPSQGLPPGTGRVSGFLYASLPVLWGDLKHYTSYRFECAIRSSAILGFIGLPTLGYHLETWFREGMYAQAFALLYFFYLLILAVKKLIKPKLLPWLVLASLLLVSKEVSFSWGNITRFVARDLLPWPLRQPQVWQAEGPGWWGPLWDWAWGIARTEAWEGLFNTLLLTQIVLVGAGLVAVLGFPLASRHFSGLWTRPWGHGLLLVLRTTPEYLLAYVLVQLWGPSFLPAVVAISLHNGAILGYLNANNADLLRLEIDSSKKKLNRYLYEVLPRIGGQFLAFLFYRWEVMMRESALLGILGIYTLGFFIDSAMAANQLDKAWFLILVTALLNIGIDGLSQFLRRRVKLSTGLVQLD